MFGLCWLIEWLVRTKRFLECGSNNMTTETQLTLTGLHLVGLENQENGRSTTKLTLDPFSRKFEYRLLRLSAVVGMSYGVIVAPVLSASPFAISVVKYVAPVCAVVGAAAGARYGFCFNIVNHCRRGSLLWAIIGGTLAGAGATLVVALMAAVAGTVGGFACGWVVGSLLTSGQRGSVPLIGTGLGALVQATWADPFAATRMAAWGGVIGAVIGSLFLATCAALGYFVLRKTRPRSWGP